MNTRPMRADDSPHPLILRALRCELRGARDAVRPPSEGFRTLSATSREALCSPSSVSAPPSASSAASRRSPASISTSKRARSSSLSGGNGAGKTHAAATARRARPAALGRRRRCSAVDLTHRPQVPPPPARARRVTSPVATTTSPFARTSSFALACSGRTGRRRATRPSTARPRSARATSCHGKLSAGQRRRLPLAIALAANAASSCCSTNRTPGSTPRAGRPRRGLRRRRRPRTRTVISRRTSSSAPGRSRRREVVLVHRPGRTGPSRRHGRRSRHAHEHAAGGRARRRARTCGSKPGHG